MSRTSGPGIRIEYDVVGTAGDPIVILVAGLGRQLVDWDPAFCSTLASTGLRVVRMDNRDAGLSDRIEGPKMNLSRLAADRAAGRPLDVPYTLADMAGDVAVVLDHLGAGAAHLVGVSMGGRIVLRFALEHPGRALSLTSIASTTGAPDVGQATPRGNKALFTPPPPHREGAIETMLEARRLLAADGTFDESWERPRVTAEVDRAFYPVGVGRQLAATWAEADRTLELQQLDLPALVIHGTEDPLIDVSGGRATAAAVPGARLIEIADMGHDIAPRTWPIVLPAIASLIHDRSG